MLTYVIIFFHQSHFVELHGLIKVIQEILQGLTHCDRHFIDLKFLVNELEQEVRYYFGF